MKQFNIGAILAGAYLALALCTSPMSAQMFEEDFGDTCTEAGSGMVHLSTGGYAYAGTTWSPNAGAGGNNCGTATSDALVIALDNVGGLVWQKTYDFGGNDAGMDVRECSNGDLVVVGYTDNTGASCMSAGNIDILIMRLNAANGNIIWSKTYGTADSAERAFRIIEATQNAGGGTAAGDLVVAGEQKDPNSANWRGVIMRVAGNNGNIVWSRVYSITNTDITFRALDESTVAGLNIGDIIVAGDIDGYNQATNGIIVRVAGRNGTFVGGAPRGTAVYGGTNLTHFRAVQELQTGTPTGDIVAAGSTTTMGNDEIYLVQTGPNPCSVVSDAKFGDGGGVGGGVDGANAFREIIITAGSNLIQGDLAVTGVTSLRPGGQGDAFLLEVTSSPFNIAGLGFKIYGTTAGLDYGADIDVVLVSAGTSTDGFGIVGGDQRAPLGQQLYAIKTSSNGTTNCNDSAVTVTRNVPGYTANCPNVTTSLTLDTCGRSINPVSQTWFHVICADSSLGARGGSRTTPLPGSGDDHGAVSSVSQTKAGEGASISVSPNPVPVGRAIEIACRAGGSRGEVTVSDLTGGIVHRSSHDLSDGLGRISVGTDGWSSGTYVIRVTIGGREMTERVVVAGK